MIGQGRIRRLPSCFARRRPTHRAGGSASGSSRCVRCQRSAHGGCLAGQLAVGQRLAEQAAHHASHLLRGVGAAVVVPPAELCQIASQVLRAHVMVRAVAAALQQGPERFQAVDMRLAPHVLARRVLDCLVPELLHAAVSCRLWIPMKRITRSERKESPLERSDACAVWGDLRGWPPSRWTRLSTGGWVIIISSLLLCCLSAGSRQPGPRGRLCLFQIRARPARGGHGPVAPVLLAAPEVELEVLPVGLRKRLLAHLVQQRLEVALIPSSE